jgi:thioredoxin-related protein
VEFPHLQKIFEKYQSRNFVMVGINAQRSEDDLVPAMLKNLGVSFPALRMPDDQWCNTNYKVTGLPRLMLVDTTGRLVLEPHVYTAAEQRILESAIEALLPQTP